MTNLTLKGSSYRVVNLIFYVARERDGEMEGKRWGDGGKEMGRGRERDGEIEGERWGKGVRELGRERERDGERE